MTWDDRYFDPMFRELAGGQGISSAPAGLREGRLLSGLLGVSGRGCGPVD